MHLIDITHTVDNKTPIYPGDNKTTFTLCRNLKDNGYNSYMLSSCLHAGTHIDMPLHLLDEKKTAVDYPPENFIGDGVIIDVRGENPIRMKEEYLDKVFESAVVLLYTGFSDKFYESSYYTEFPVIDMEFAKFLISKKIKVIGLDSPSTDYAPFPVHKALLSSNIFILENLTNLHNLLNLKKFEVMALPLKITAEASLVRAVCRIY